MLRAIDVLEHVGTKEAREVLRGIMEGSPDSRGIKEAHASLERLAARAASS